MVTSFFTNFSFLFFFKVTIILFLFGLNIYLYFIDSNSPKNKHLESGVFNTDFIKTKYISYAAGVASLYGIYLTYTEMKTNSQKENTNFNSKFSDLISTIQQSIDDKKVTKTSEGEPINKSFLLSEVFNKFETLDLFSKLAVSILFLKNVLISALISIIFVLYGDILIKNYKLESRFPKLTQIIELRRKFSRYYLILNCSIVVLVILTEVVFCLAVLLH